MFFLKKRNEDEEDEEKKPLELVHTHLWGGCPTHRALGLTGQLINSTLVLFFPSQKFPSFPASPAGRKGWLFSCLCEVCRPLCPPGQCFTCSPSQGDGWKMLWPQGDQRAARTGWSSLSLSSEYIVCDPEPFLKVKKGSNHCRKSTWR